jgi:hypothetical protein
MSGLFSSLFWIGWEDMFDWIGFIVVCVGVGG